MAVNSKLLEILPDGYGFVVLVAIDSVFLNMWLGRNVSKARIEHNVPYPLLYSPENEKFNCVQRAHQHFLEVYSPFTLLLLTGGLQYPKIAASAGALFLLSRIAFAKGYYTGDPKKRSWGSFGIAGIFTLVGCTSSLAAHALGWLPYKA